MAQGKIDSQKLKYQGRLQAIRHLESKELGD